ncbi:MAG: acylneuraminate cytidylyltransferase family protein [bacterium]|nr:acylneuraminate cytidylyltransferase family protein [bacterium]
MIPARGGSKGVPRKNLAPLAGRPLLTYIVESAQAAAGIMHLIVSTDDEAIVRVATTAGAHVPELRPAALADDHVSLVAVSRYALTWADAAGLNPEWVLSLQPTAPFLKPATIERAIALVRDTGCDSAATVVPVEHHHPYRILNRLDDGRVTFRDPESAAVHPQRQDLPPVFSFTGGLYLRCRRVLEKWEGKGWALGTDCRGVDVSLLEAVNIDTPMDLAFANFLMKNEETRLAIS